MQRRVLLVDKNDQELGTAEILKAHQGKGLKHRALSIILYRQKNRKTEILLQKRSVKKPVFRRLWGNTCCTNLRPGDEYLARAVSRLKEEMGIEIKEKDLQILYRFSYEAPDLKREGWGENELDTVIVGEYGGAVTINPEEAEDYKWREWEELEKEAQDKEGEYAPWLKIILEDGRVKEHISKRREDAGK